MATRGPLASWLPYIDTRKFKFVHISASMPLLTLSIFQSTLAFSPAAQHTYKELSSTCQNAVAVSSKLSVQSIADCESRCDANPQCVAVDTDGSSCFLKSHCDGDLGGCHGSQGFWCGYRKPLLAMARGDRPLTIGVLGGSISWGAKLERPLAERYSTLLAQRLNASVINSAVPATGVATPALCLELVMPQWQELDVLVVEYAANDALASTSIADAAGALTPQALLERLLRTVLAATAPPPLIIVLAVCEWFRNPLDRCSTLFHDVSAYYRQSGVLERSLRDARPPKRGMRHFNHSMSGHIHPTRWGHAAIANLLAHDLRSESHTLGMRRRSAPLPPPRWQERGATATDDKPWQCLACRYTDQPGLESRQTCPGLRPAAARGFALHTIHDSIGNRNSREGLGHSKPGWRGTAAGSFLEVALGAAPGPRQVLLEALCSYENVGRAGARLLPTDAAAGHRWRRRSRHRRSLSTDGAAAVAGRGGVAVQLDLRWSVRSSQHCLLPVGTAPARTNTTLRLTVITPAGGARGANQVKVYGVLLKPLGGQRRTRGPAVLRPTHETRVRTPRHSSWWTRLTGGK